MGIKHLQGMGCQMESVSFKFQPQMFRKAKQCQMLLLFKQTMMLVCYQVKGGAKEVSKNGLSTDKAFVQTSISNAHEIEMLADTLFTEAISSRQFIFAECQHSSNPKLCCFF